MKAWYDVYRYTIDHGLTKHLDYHPTPSLLRWPSGIERLPFAVVSGLIPSQVKPMTFKIGIHSLPA